MNKFSQLELYEIAYRLERLPQITNKMLERGINHNKLHNCTCTVCDKEFLYTSTNKKTCSDECYEITLLHM